MTRWWTIALGWTVVVAALVALATPAAQAGTVSVRFHSEFADLQQVPRDDGGKPVESAVRWLLKGPTDVERMGGLRTAIPQGTYLVKLVQEGQSVSADLSEHILQGLDEAALTAITEQFHSTLGDFDWIRSIRLTLKGQLLSTYLKKGPEVGGPPTENPEAGVQLTGLGGRNITLGPSHGRFWNGSGWYWQRSDPCGLGEAVLEDTNSIRLMQFLYQYLAQDGAAVHVARQLNESDCCNGYEGQPWWKMASYSWLRINGLPTSVWANSSGVGGEETATNRSSDDIRARPKFADYRGSEIYIAHHTNAGGGTGMETFRDTAMDYPAHEANSYNLALSVHNNTIDAIREMYDGSWANRGVKDAAGGFGEIRVPNRPACLVELAFHDKCDKDAPYLTDDFFRSVAMWGMYNGVCAYFGTSPTWGKYSDEYVSDTIPTTMTEGQTYSVSVTFRNRGVLWRNDRAFRLGAAGDSDPFTSTTRHGISGDVRPGNTYTFTFNMTAPAPGSYTTDWQMLREGVTWFGATCTKTVNVIPSHNYQKGWMLIGPYSSDSIENNNLGVDEASLWASSAVGLNGDTWQTYDSSGSYVDLDSALGASEMVTSYAWSYVHTAAAKNVYMFTGSDDQIRVWLNGAKVHEYLSPRGHVFDANSTPVTLNAGWNRLLVKVHDNGGGFGFSLRFADDAGGSTDTTGLSWRKDDWTPTQIVTSVNGVAGTPALGAELFGNWTNTDITGTASNGGGPIGWNVRQRTWGATQAHQDVWYNVSGSPSGTSWSHSAADVGGHTRWHFQNLSGSGRTSTQWNTTGGSSWFDIFTDRAAPDPPALIAVPSGTTSVNLTLTVPQDKGSGPGAEDGAVERKATDSGVVENNWYRVGDVAVQVRRGAPGAEVAVNWTSGTSVADNGRTPNTEYSYVIQGRDNSTETRGAWHNYTDWSAPVTVVTAIETPGLSVTDLTTTSISLQSSGSLTDLAAGSSATRIVNTTASTDSGWAANAMASWICSGLTSNTEYSFQAESRNRVGDPSSPSAPVVRYTRTLSPTGDMITCDQTPSTPYPASTLFTFTCVPGFGSVNKPSAIRYVWNQSPTYAFSGGEALWDSGMLQRSSDTQGSYYLHLQCLNGDNVPSQGTLSLGPYVVDTGAASEPLALNATGRNGVFEIRWTPGSNTARVQVERSISAGGAWSVVDANVTASSWLDPDTYAAGETRYYRLTSFSQVGNPADVRPTISVRNTISGTNLWNYSTTAATLAPPSFVPALQAVFASSNDQHLHSMNANSGGIVWMPFLIGSPVSARAPISYVGGKYLMFAGAQDGHVHALNAATGVREWDSFMGWGNQVLAKVAGQNSTMLTTGPMTGQTRMVVLAPSYNTDEHTANFLRAYDGLTGVEHWTFAPGNMDIVPGSPAVYPPANTVVFASYAGSAALQPSVWAVDTRSGALKWSANIGHVGTSPAMTLDGAYTYVAANNNTLWKFRTSDGQVMWSFDLEQPPYGSPWQLDDKIFVATASRLWCLQDLGSAAQPHPSWSGGRGWVPVAGPSQPVYSNIAGKLYVGSVDGKIWELSQATGAGSFTLTGTAMGDPVIDYSGRRLFAGAADGRIYAYAIPFLRADELTLFGVLAGTGQMIPDGPFNPYALYAVRARTVWRGLGPGTHVQTTRWYTPSGQLYQQMTSTFSADGSGNPLETWVQMPIAGTGAQRLVGSWRVDVYVDDTVTVHRSRNFIFQ